MVSCYLLLVVFAVDLLATSGDFTQAWTSAAFPKLKSNDSSVNPLGTPITSDEDAWMASLLNIGAIIGAIPFGFIADHIGRKMALLSIGIPHIIAYLIYAFAENVYLFHFGRFINGFAYGAGYTLLPMYIAEISEDRYRGALSVTMNMFWTFGNFVPVAIGPYMSMKLYNIILACFPISFFVLFLIFGIESPYYYIKTNQSQKAEHCLMKLRQAGESEVEEEIYQIKSTFKQQEDLELMDIFKNPGLRNALIISLMLIIFQQLSGIAAIQYYMQLIFEASGSKLPSDISSTICGGWTFITSIVNVFSTDRLGRKLPLVISCFGMSVPLALLGIFFHLNDKTEISTSSLYWLPIFCLLLYIFAFNFGMSAMPWTISSELFPSNVKRISAPAISVMCWVASFIVTKFFNDMNELMGRGGSFWFFGISSIAAGLFTIFFVPETNGKSFSEIHDMLVHKKH